MSESFTFGQTCFESPSLTKSTENDQQKRVQKDPTTIILPSKLCWNKRRVWGEKQFPPPCSGRLFDGVKNERVSYRRSMRRRRSVTCSVVFLAKNRNKLIIRENPKTKRVLCIKEQKPEVETIGLTYHNVLLAEQKAWWNDPEAASSWKSREWYFDPPWRLFWNWELAFAFPI